MLKRYPVTFFFFLAYGISWACLSLAPAIPASLKPTLGPILVLLATFSPSLAGLTMMGLVEGPRGVKRLLGGLLKFRVKLRWYLLALFGLGTLMLLSVAASALLTSRPVEIYIQHAWILLPLFADAFLLGGGLGEEFGWRGFALPRLQERFNPLTASLVLGLFWGLWHLPDFWLSSIRDDESLPLFLLAILPLSILYTWVYNRTQGSVLIVALAHAAANATSATLDLAMPQAAAGLLPQSLLLALLWLSALAVIVSQGRSLGR